MPSIESRISAIASRKNNSRRAAPRFCAMAISRVAVIALVLCALVFAGIAKAQTTSTIQGTITDKQGLAIGAAELHLSGDVLGTNRTATTDSGGTYAFTNIPAGNYSLTVSHTGFSTRSFNDLEVTLNRTLTFNVVLEVGQASEIVKVSAEPPLLETSSSSSGATILPQDIGNMPINGRNYLDLLQMVPGVAVYRQADVGSDNATPILGERGNNTGFLIDGQPNENELAGGAAAQFNQDTIAEFQVITTGYKAEFGHSSGGMVNVISKSGGNEVHGLASGYHRNSAFDSADIPSSASTSNIPGQTEPPYLLRWDYDAAAGGAMVKDKAYWFASAENIHENQALNFVPPKGTPQFILDNEETFNEPTTDNETRVFGKLDQTLGLHHLTEEVNYTNVHVNSSNPLSASTALPSTRGNDGDRNLFLGFADTMAFGDVSSPFILSLRGQYRNENTLTSPAHPQAGPNTLFNLFSSFDTGGVFGDSPQFSTGATFTPSTISQKYGILGASIEKSIQHHIIKFGWDFEHTHVDGVEANAQQNQLFTTQSDYEQFGPINAGFFLLLTVGGQTPQDNDIKLRNSYNGLWLQDDWKVTRTLTVNLGVRWDYDSAFKITTNVSPRIGFAWSVTPKTVIRGSFGDFYDHFRLGLVRDIPGFGGANIVESQPLSFPRLFYGVPTIAPNLFSVCDSTNLTDAQIAAAGATCPFAGAFGNGPAFYGIDHLNNLGPTPIPANTAVNMGNVQQLSGLTPSAFLSAADAAIGKPDGFWTWGPFGTLSFFIANPNNFPVTIDPSFATPFTRSETLGVQRQLGDDWVVSLDFYHKDINNLLGVRETNLPFTARLDDSGGGLTQVNGFGPWYGGTYNAAVLSFEKRFSKRFTVGGSYSYVSENDDALNSNLGTSAVGGGNGFPTDSFRGIVPTVTDPGTAKCPSQTNATASFIACNGNFVPKAGIFYNGATLDDGPSDFALRHSFQIHSLVELPWKIQLTNIFRAQSGFRYTATAAVPLDQDGNGNFGGRDLKTGRNAFSASPFVNMDMRFSRTWVFRERYKIQGLFEFFNLFNNANPAAIQSQQAQAATFGQTSEWLPGRQGQIGLKLEF